MDVLALLPDSNAVQKLRVAYAGGWVDLTRDIKLCCRRAGLELPLLLKHSVVALFALLDKELQVQLFLTLLEGSLRLLVGLAVLESFCLLLVQLGDLVVVESRQEPEATVHCFRPLSGRVDALGGFRGQARLQCVIVQGSCILELIDLASQVFNLIPGVDLSLLQCPPRVD